MVGRQPPPSQRRPGWTTSWQFKASASFPCTPPKIISTGSAPAVSADLRLDTRAATGRGDCCGASSRWLAGEISQPSTPVLLALALHHWRSLRHGRLLSGRPTITYSLFPRPVPREREVLEKEPEGAASRGRLIPFGRHAGRILDTGCSFAAHREEHSAPTARAGDELLRPYRAPPTAHGRGRQLPATRKPLTRSHSRARSASLSAHAWRIASCSSGDIEQPWTIPHRSSPTRIPGRFSLTIRAATAGS